MKVDKVNELVCNVTDKENYSIHIVVLTQALNHGLVLNKYIVLLVLNKRHG